MGVTASYVVEFDVDRDETYNNALDDVSAFVASLSWTNGMTTSFQQVADSSRLTLVLYNGDNRFSQDDNTASYYGLLVRGTLVRVTVTYSATPYIMYYGRIKQVITTPGTDSERTVTVICEDPITRLLDAEFEPSILTDVTADTALDTLFDEAVVPWPYEHEFWMIGVAGSAELGETTYLWNHSATSFETGDTTFAFVGDVSDRGTGVKVGQYIYDIVRAEDGRFWFDTRTNQYIFHNRNFDIIDLTVDATFDEADFSIVVYSQSEEVVNHLTLNYTPREVGAAQSVIWSATNVPLALSAKQEKNIHARYRDPDEETARVGAQNFIDIVTGTDLVANSASDGSGNDRTRRISFSVAFAATGADIHLKNTHRRTVYITTLQLRGTPLITKDRQYVESIDGPSVAAYERIQKAIDVNLMDTEEKAQSYADWYVSKFKDPLTRFASVTVPANATDALMTQALTRTIGHRITITEAFVGHDRDYIIVGEQHQVQAGGDHTHNTTWVLIPADRVQYWLLGTTDASELGETTKLGY